MAIFPHDHPVSDRSPWTPSEPLRWTPSHTAPSGQHRQGHVPATQGPPITQQCCPLEDRLGHPSVVLIPAIFHPHNLCVVGSLLSGIVVTISRDSTLDQRLQHIVKVTTFHRCPNSYQRRLISFSMSPALPYYVGIRLKVTVYEPYSYTLAYFFQSTRKR